MTGFYYDVWKGASRREKHCCFSAKRRGTSVG
jgi:hypothetical protein